MVINKNEAHVVINGITLNDAQSMTLRVAIESFATSLILEGLGDDKIGVDLCSAYIKRISEIRFALYQ